jgi:DnaA-homolog protein
LVETPGQLHLPLEFVPEPTLAEFLAGPNDEAVAAITAAAADGGEPFLFLSGGPATGKTHLLQAACLAAMARGRQAAFIPLGTPGLSPGVLDDLDQLALVAVDDLQRVLGDHDWEIALFALFNRMRERGHRLLIAADAAPEALPVKLPDLASRLLWGPRYHLKPLTDLDSARLLSESAERRGLRLGPNLVRFIMSHHPRDSRSLMGLIARIDSLSLREQRQPTLPLVQRAMREPL